MKITILFLAIMFAAFALFSTSAPVSADVDKEAGSLILVQMSGGSSGATMGGTGHETRKGVGPAPLDSGRNPMPESSVGGADTDEKDQDSRKNAAGHETRKGVGPAPLDSGKNPMPESSVGGKGSTGSAQ